MKKAAIFYLPLLVLTACVKENNGDNNGTAQSQTYKDVAYGSDGKQKMDIYLPQGRSADSTKTFVIIHGGGWAEGDKNEMTFAVDSLKKRLPAYAFINLNYRLAYNNTNNLFPSQENDVKTAIEFYLGKSAEYKVSKDLIVVGASAGGHLALLHSYKNDPDKHVKAVVDYFGPADLHSLWNVSLVQQLILTGATGKLYDQDPAIYTQSTPVNFITAQSPPTIAVHGDADLLVPIDQSVILINKLSEKAVINQLITYPGGGHGDWPVETYTDSFNKIQAFIAANVH
ncbi:MAG: alpha/beta hydrolase [Chitinophagaceae bacterium]|nr:alpha/beta hydrolase [Chitinophagaceae bacterium]